MTLAEIFGFLGGALGILTALPQTLRVRRMGSAEGVSQATWFITYASNCAWFSYGIKTHSPSQVVTSVLSAIIIVSVLVAISTNKPRTYLLLLAGPLTFTSLAAFLSLAPLSRMLLCFSLARVPQVMKSWRTWREAEDSSVSIHTWVISGVSSLLWLMYATLGHRPIVIVTSSLGITLTALILTFEFASKRRVAASLVGN